MPKPGVARLVISETASSATDPADEGLWLVDIAYSDLTIHKALKIVDPFTAAEETQCRWYVETYSSQDPFEEKKARIVADLIDGYGANLFGQLRWDRVFDRDDEHALIEPLILEIDVSEERKRAKPDRSGIHRLHWELLEAPSLWQNRFGEIVVRRRVQEGFGSSSNVRKEGPDPISGTDGRSSFNVLLVLARDTSVNGTSYQDVDPSATTNVFLAIQRELKQLRPDYCLNLEVVRPGTFAAFQKHLRRSTQRGMNRHYHLVHFDLHGKIANQVQEDGRRIRTACLRFASSKSLTRLELIPAEAIAKELQSHNIDCAVLNACDSARSDDGMNANLAGVFAKHGVSNILAMSYKFLSSAAAPFFASFYRNFLVHRLNFSSAASKARRVLLKNPLRQARLGMELEVKDWFVSVVYISGEDMQIDGPQASAPTETSASDVILSLGADSDSSVIGRDYDILRLERVLADSDVVFLHGAPGVGKSVMMRHAVETWRKTDGYDLIIVIDLLKDPITIAEIEKQVVDQIGAFCETSRRNSDTASSASEIIQTLRHKNVIVILDGLDLVYAKVFNEGFDVIQNYMYDLLRLIRKPPSEDETAQLPKLILIGVLGKSWWDEHFGFLEGEIFPLEGLDLPATLQLSKDILRKVGKTIGLANQKELDSLANIVNILQRIPLALELVLPQVAEMDLSFKDFYDKLHFGDVVVPLFAPGKPPKIANLKLMLQFKTIFDRFHEFRDMLCCLADFWHEGPQRMDEYLKELRNGAGVHLEDRLDKIILCLSDCGGWRIEGGGSGTPRTLCWIHPLLTLSLRQMRRSHEFQGPPFWHRGIVKALQFMESGTVSVPFGSTSTIRTAIARGFVHAVAVRDEVRTLTSALLGFNGPKLGQEMRGSMYNMLTCYRICCLPETRFEVRSWPKNLLVSYLGPSRLIMSLPEQELLAKYVEDVLTIYVRECQGFEVPPGDRSFVLNLSLHLTTFAASYGWLDRERIRQFLAMSSAVVEASESRYGRFEGSDIVFKGMVSRYQAVEALIDGNEIAADEAWEKMKATDIEYFGPESVNPPVPHTGSLNMENLLGSAGPQIAPLSTPNGLAAMSTMLNFSRTDNTQRDVLASWAQARHSAWPWLKERILATKDASLIDSLYLPKINRSFQGISDAQDKAGIEGMGHWKRFFPPCNDVAAQLERVQDSKWQIEELESARDRGDWRGAAQSHMELWRTNAAAQDFDRALYHLTALTGILKESGPPWLPLEQMEGQKRLLEMLIRFKAMEAYPTGNIDDSACLEFVEAMKQAGEDDVGGWLRAQGVPEVLIRELLSAASRSERLLRLITEGMERRREKERREKEQRKDFKP